MAAADERLAELEAGHREPIAVTRRRLLDVAALLERREQPEDVILVDTEATRELGHTELFLRLKGFKQTERVIDALDHVVPLRPLHTEDPSGLTPIALRRRASIEAGFPTEKT
ncbi:MAG TPA: hypothetical protein VKM54_08010 [Myxococcota bacterium]|nr:hypothetical protein [Myxococcota bacterium]